MVRVPLDGVPSAPFSTTAAPADPMFTAKAVATPVPSPLTPEAIGSPVPFVSTTEDGVPNAGVVKLGEVPKTSAPEPVSPVTADARFPLVGEAKKVATPVPRPETPEAMGSPVALVRVPEDGVPRAPPLMTGAPAEPMLTASAVATPVPRPEIPEETGSPVALVSVPEDGVPNAPPFTTNAPAEPTLVPSAVSTPVPVVTVAGVAPAPPPTIKALAARRAELAHPVVDEKYGIPPEVPAIVNASVPEVVIGLPAMETIPPVKLAPTDVTVPEPPPPPPQLAPVL